MDARRAARSVLRFRERAVCRPPRRDLGGSICARSIRFRWVLRQRLGGRPVPRPRSLPQHGSDVPARDGRSGSLACGRGRSGRVDLLQASRRYACVGDGSGKAGCSLSGFFEGLGGSLKRAFYKTRLASKIAYYKEHPDGLWGAFREQRQQRKVGAKGRYGFDGEGKRRSRGPSYREWDGNWFGGGRRGGGRRGGRSGGGRGGFGGGW